MSETCWEDRTCDPGSRKPITWRDMQRDILWEEIARYRVYAFYFLGPYRPRRLVLATGKTWEEANLLRGRLQERQDRREKARTRWKPSRVYCLQLEGPKPTLHWKTRDLKEALRGPAPAALVPGAYRQALEETSAEALLLYLTDAERATLGTIMGEVHG